MGRVPTFYWTKSIQSEQVWDAVTDKDSHPEKPEACSFAKASIFLWQWAVSEQKALAAGLPRDRISYWPVDPQGDQQ